MKKHNFEFSGLPRRLDLFLTGEAPGVSRPFARTLIERGLATVNGERKKPGYVLRDGDKVLLELPEPEAAASSFGDLVLFEDAHLLAVAKPAGLAVHPNSPHWETNPEASLVGEPTLVSLLLGARPAAAGSGLTRLGLVHRLDRDTSGLMLVAKTPEAQASLSEGFRDRLLQKTYLGGVGGIPVEASGTIDAPIGRAGGFKKIKVWEFGRDAVTCFKIKERGRDAALLEISPKTGRTNQIRIHMEYIGHPIIGDRLYNGIPAERMLLHSYKLKFSHPATGRSTTLTCPLPEDFKKVWKRYGK